MDGAIAQRSGPVLRREIIMESNKGPQGGGKAPATGPEVVSEENSPAKGPKAQRGYNRRGGGRPPLEVDFVAVCDAVVGALQGNGETITSVAKRFGVSRAWIHQRVYPVVLNRG